MTQMYRIMRPWDHANEPVTFEEVEEFARQFEFGDEGDIYISNGFDGWDDPIVWRDNEGQGHTLIAITVEDDLASKGILRQVEINTESIAFTVEVEYGLKGKAFADAVVREYLENTDEGSGLDEEEAEQAEKEIRAFLK